MVPTIVACDCFGGDTFGRILQNFCRRASYAIGFVYTFDSTQQAGGTTSCH
jgi:hypothetical protein